MLEGRPILGETYNHMHFLFTGRWFYEWHGARGGGVIYKWQVGGGWAYNRLFTVYELLCQAPYVTD